MSRITEIPSEHKGYKKYAFMCPGCKHSHAFNTTWQFNDDFENPTVSPSILVKGPDFDGNMETCHSFIKEGKIQFLNDCTHELAGQTVDLPDWED